MAKTPSSFTQLLRRPSPKIIQNPKHPIRSIGYDGCCNDNDDKPLLHSIDIVKQICATIRSKPRWENTLVSDFPGVSFLDSGLLNQVLVYQNNAFLSIRFLYWLSSKFGYSPDQSICSFVFNSLVEDKAANAAKSFLDFTRFVPDRVGLEAYVRCLCESGMIEDALQVFDEMKKTSVCPLLETWNCILQACVKEGCTDILWELYGEMMELGVDGDVHTVDYLIQAFCLDKNCSKGYELLRQMLDDGNVPHKVSFDTLISEFILDKKYMRVSALLHIMLAKGINPDLYTYQQIIHTLCLKRMQREGLRIFNDLKDRGYAPDRIMYTTMIHGLCKIKWFGEARKLWFEMIQKGIKPNQYTYNTLLYGYFKIGDIKNALKFFKEMQDKGYRETVIAYNTMINGMCSHGRASLAFRLFNRMSRKNVSKDVVTYNSMIRGFCNEGKLDEGLNLLHELVGHGLQPSSASYGPLIEKLYEMKRIDEVKNLWSEMQDKDVEPASVCIDDNVIIGLSNKGYVAAGIYWLAYMLKNRLIPRQKSFESLIRVLSERGRLDVGLIAMGHMFKIGYIPSLQLDLRHEIGILLYIMVKGKLILICQSGGEFVTNDDGTMSYHGGEANAANVTSETPFSDMKLSLAETCNLNQETVTMKYFLPGNKRTLITVKHDKDVKRMIDFHGDAITAEVFVTGTPGFNRSALEMQTNRHNPVKNHEAVNNDNLTTKKDENVEQGKVGPKKNKKVKKLDKVAKSPIATPARRTRQSVAAAAAAKIEASSRKKEKKKEIPNRKRKQKQNTVSSDDNKLEGSTNDLDCNSDPVPIWNAKRKEVTPADGAKKRRRTLTWKVGANGHPTVVSNYAMSKSKGGSGNKKSQIKSGRLAAKGYNSQETKSRKKRGRPRAITSGEEHDDFVGPSSDDDMSPETLVSLWKSAITGAGQQFTSVQKFQETLRRYAIANDFEFKLKKNGSKQAIGKCSSEGCSWKFNAVLDPSTESFKIKTMKNVHTCDRVSKNWLLDTIKEKLHDSPHLKPKEVANELLKDFGLESKSNRKQVFPGTLTSSERLHGSDKGSYNKLPWFCEKIKVTNPGSISNLVIDENKRFKALFVSFYASFCGFQNSCRPLVFLEATSLRSVYGEVLFVANAIDGNDDFFPVAFAVVDVEDDNNWRWFLEQLKTAIYNYQSITFVFDREKNLKPYIVEVFQDSHVGYSMYHLLESFKRNVKGPFHGDDKSFLLIHFLDAAHAVRLGGFKKSTEQIKQISSEAYDWVMQIEPQHWTTSSFKGERYNHIIDDVSRPLSKLMEDNQELSILHKIDAIIRTMVDSINDAKLDGIMWSTHLTPSKEKQLLKEIVKSCGLKVLISSDTLFEVREDSTHVVNIGNWSCTCLRWKETGLPCRHALAVFALTGKNLYAFCSSYFTVAAYRLTYMEPISPVPIDKSEGEEMEIEKAGGENEQALRVEGENVHALRVVGENEEGGVTETRTDKEDCEKVEVEDKKDEKMDIEIEIRGGENEKGEKAEGEKEEVKKDEESVLVLPPIPAKPVDVMEKENMHCDETEVEPKRTVTCTKCKQPGHNKKSCTLFKVQEAC
ncbi:hypothetical protein QVD17_26323 [Tagetes erecta]|uniref:SWIM-type domain-containing protein n=1 Tax=Tagetes erecta TaxID=13708 RepID=A0AAD8NQ01_TARER|nr:hypothetical protein QVD17_26323 [Tagetes erecta]